MLKLLKNMKLLHLRKFTTIPGKGRQVDAEEYNGFKWGQPINMLYGLALAPAAFALGHYYEKYKINKEKRMKKAQEVADRDCVPSQYG